MGGSVNVLNHSYENFENLNLDISHMQLNYSVGRNKKNTKSKQSKTDRKSQAKQKSTENRVRRNVRPVLVSVSNEESRISVVGDGATTLQGSRTFNSSRVGTPTSAIQNCFE